MDDSGCVAWRSLIPTIKGQGSIEIRFANDQPDRTAASSPKGREFCWMMIRGRRRRNKKRAKKDDEKKKKREEEMIRLKHVQSTYRVHTEYMQSTCRVHTEDMLFCRGYTLQEVEQKVGMYNVDACAFPFPFLSFSLLSFPLFSSPFLSFPFFSSPFLSLPFLQR